MTRGGVDAREQALDVGDGPVELLDCLTHLVPNFLVFFDLVLEVLKDLGVEQAGGWHLNHVGVAVHSE